MPTKVILLVSWIFTTQLLAQPGNIIRDRYTTSLADAMANPMWIEVLDLSNQGLEKIPQEIGMLKNLRILLLDNNSIQKLDSTLLKFHYLEYLSINNNRLVNLDLSMVNNSSSTLKQISANNNQINFLEKEINTFKAIHTLELASNKLHKLPNLILSNLQELDLTANSLEELPHGLQDARLKTLKISDNKLSYLDFSKGYDQLETIICSNNPASTVKFGKDSKKVKKVVLDWVPMMPSDINDLPSTIVILSLEHCGISNIENLNRLENLKELSLIGNQLTSTEINKLEISELTKIWLGQNNVDMSIVNSTIKRIRQD